MATPKIDKNQWYHLYVNEDKTQALMGTNLFAAAGTRGAVFFNTTNLSANVQRWQIYPVNVNDTTVYTLRCKEGGPNGFVGAAYSEAEEMEGKTRPVMVRGDTARDNVYWTFGSWGDGTWFLYNAANGTDYHMNKKGSGLVAMSSNTTAPQNGQRWAFATIDKIDDEKYSSINLVGATTSTLKAPSVSETASISHMSELPTPSPTTNADHGANNPSSGLSRGTVAAIGAAVGGVVLLALVILGLFCWKKRRPRMQHSMPHDTPHNMYGTGNTSTTKHELHSDLAVKYEMSSTHVVELSTHYPPAELSAYTPEAQRRFPG